MFTGNRQQDDLFMQAFAGKVLEEAFNPAPGKPFTIKESQVPRMIAQGSMLKETAALLQLSPHHRQLKRILMKKLKVHSTVKLIRKVKELGLV